MRLTAVNLTRSSVGELTKKYSNLPESYIKRSLQRVEWKTPRGLPQYMPKTLFRRNRYFGLHRPWNEGFWRENEKIQAKVFVEPIKEWTIFKGDRVEILTGPDKGKQGIVSRIIEERNWAIVEGLNCELKVMGKTGNSPGTVVREEQPLLVTRELKLVDPSDYEWTDVEWRFTEEGEKVRVSKRTGRVIPLPQQAFETYDYKTKATYKESPKDTTNDDVIAVTYQPELVTFAMEIMRSAGIKETRRPATTYFY